MIWLRNEQIVNDAQDVLTALRLLSTGEPRAARHIQALLDEYLMFTTPRNEV